MKVLSTCLLGRCQTGTLPEERGCGALPALLAASPSPGLQLALRIPRRVPLQQVPQELGAGVRGTQCSPDHCLHLCHRVLVAAGTRTPRRGYQDWPPGKGVAPLHPRLGRQPPLPVQVLPLGQSSSLQCPAAPVCGLLWDFLGNLLGMQTAALRPWQGAGAPRPCQPSTTKNLPKGWSKENTSS